MQDRMDELRQLILKRIPEENVVDTSVPGVTLFRIDHSFRKRPQYYLPQIIILAQGKKRIFLGDKTFEYDPRRYYVQAVPLPVECEAVIEDGRPMLGMTLAVNPQTIGEILSAMESDLPPPPKVRTSLYDAPLSEDMVDAARRLLNTLDSSSDSRVLGPLYLKELLFKVVTGEQGEILRELAINNRGFYQVSRIINRIHEDCAQDFDVQDLAREAGMSTSAFHTTFKNLTCTSPWQYIKTVRLHRAKELIQTQGEKANQAASLVGYESATQFSREFKRFFGVTPGSARMAV